MSCQSWVAPSGITNLFTSTIVFILSLFFPLTVLTTQLPKTGHGEPRALEYSWSSHTSTRDWLILPHNIHLFMLQFLKKKKNFSYGYNSWQTDGDGRAGVSVGVYCPECNDCPKNGVIVGMPPCCDLYMSNLPPIEGQSWLVIVLKWHSACFSQNVRDKAFSQPDPCPTSLSHWYSTAMIANTHHPMVVWPGQRDVKWCDVMTTGRCSVSRNTWHDLQRWNKHRSPLNTGALDKADWKLPWK